MNEKSKTALENKISDSLRIAQGQAEGLRRTHRLLVGGTVFSGAVSTMLAGISAAGGASVIGSGPAGWQLTCGIVAVLTLIGTVTTGIDQQFRFQETMGKAQLCAGQLAAMHTLLSLDSAPVEDITQQYTALITENPAVFS